MDFFRKTLDIGYSVRPKVVKISTNLNRCSGNDPIIFANESSFELNLN